MTINGEIILIPNNIITDEVFMNYTKNDTIFLRINVSLSSNNNTNYPELFEKIKDNVRLSQYIYDKREVYVVISDLSQPGTRITVNAKVESADFFNASGDIRLRIRQTLQEYNIKLLDLDYV
jgi:small-conductance mechanosensitive channel